MGTPPGVGGGRAVTQSLGSRESLASAGAGPVLQSGQMEPFLGYDLGSLQLLAVPSLL